MNDLLLVIVFSLAGGLLSLAGGLLLLSNKRHAHKLVKYVTPFAAGALLSAAFIDVLPEAAHTGDIERALQFTLVGIVGFFLLERSLRWFHHHHGDAEHKIEANAPLIIIGDTIHNFLDGIAIAAAFLIDVPTGIITTMAVAAHEIPQEMGDFGLLLDKGMKRSSVLLANIFSAFATTFAAVVFYLLGTNYAVSLDIALGLVAGFFIYIAVSDIIPSIHKHDGNRIIGVQSVMLIVGVIVVAVTTTVLHGYIDTDEHNEKTRTQHVEEAH